VRRSGYATAIDELETGLSSLAAPVADGMAALSVSGPTLRLGTEQMADLHQTLIHEAQALGHDMGVHAA
jgi:DNA-binding IclR family transcriptional regulator